ncbi:MAG: hypothetical protein ACYTGT_20505, partial [Planctomycetota bacterium]
MRLVFAARGEDDVALVVDDHDLQPALDDVEGARGIVVPDFIRGKDRPDRDLLARRNLRRDVEGELHDRALGPLVADLGDLERPLEPLVGEVQLLLPS